jgi:hypothetical protein
MSEIDRTKLPTDFLASLNQHLREHGLGDTILSINLPNRVKDCGRVQIYPFRSTDLALFAEWLRTLRGATVTVAGFSQNRDRQVHVRAVGEMVDGTVVQVQVILDDDEFDLLAANTPLVKDATIEVELLLSLVSAEQAEHCEPALARTAVA